MLLWISFFTVVIITEGKPRVENDQRGCQMVVKLRECAGSEMHKALIGAYGLQEDQFLVIPYKNEVIENICKEKMNHTLTIKHLWEKCFENEYIAQINHWRLHLLKYLGHPCNNDEARKEFIGLLHNCSDYEQEIESKCIRHQIIAASKLLSYPKKYWRNLMCCAFGHTSECFMRCFTKCNIISQLRLTTLWGVGNMVFETKVCSASPKNMDCDDPPHDTIHITDEEEVSYRFISALAYFVLNMY